MFIYVVTGLSNIYTQTSKHVVILSYVRCKSMLSSNSLNSNESFFLERVAYSTAYNVVQGSDHWAVVLSRSGREAVYAHAGFAGVC